MSKLIKGAVVLAVAAVISKLMGTLQKIPLQNIAGDGVFGIYNAVYPFYILVLFLATAGFPIAVSKFVSEYAAQGRRQEARRVLRLAAAALMGTGVACFAVLYFGSGRIAELIGNQQTALAIRSVSFALLFVPLMAALRGYFQGMQDMVPTGVSQVAEQLIRVATMLGLLLYMTGAGYTEEWVAAGATFGSVTGAAAGLLVMILYTRGQSRREALDPARGSGDETAGAAPRPEPAWRLLRRFALYAMPICLGAIVVPILNIVDAFTMPRLLQRQGYDELESMVQFGVYSRGLPLVQLVSMLASSVSVALVPAMAEGAARKDWNGLRVRAELAMRLTWLIGLAASAGLAAAVLPINTMLYTDGAGSGAMAILAFTALFSTAGIVSTSMMQGYGRVALPAVNLLAAAVIKVALNLLLLPKLGISGAAISAVVAFAAACALNMAVLRRDLGVEYGFGRYWLRPALALLLMTGVILVLLYGSQALLAALPLQITDRGAATIQALAAVAGGAAAFGYAVFRFRLLTEDDFRHAPQLGRKALPLLKRLRLL